MKTLYREPLTATELNQHKNSYELETPAVYVGTYRKYNDGNLFGEWLDLSTFDDYDEFLEFCYRLHADEKDPELMFQDYECFPRAYYGESYLEFDKIQAWYELDEDKRQAYDIYLNHHDENATIEEFEEHYQGQWDSPEDFAENLIEECGDLAGVPEWLQNCIDWSAVWRNLDTGGDYWECDGHIFSCY